MEVWKRHNNFCKIYNKIWILLNKTVCKISFFVCSRLLSGLFTFRSQFLPSKLVNRNFSRFAWIERSTPHKKEPFRNKYTSRRQRWCQLLSAAVKTRTNSYVALYSPFYSSKTFTPELLYEIKRSTLAISVLQTSARFLLFRDGKNLNGPISKN